MESSGLVVFLVVANRRLNAGRRDINGSANHRRTNLDRSRHHRYSRIGDSHNGATGTSGA